MRLHHELRVQRAMVKSFEDGIRDFEIHLCLPKFQGQGNDYINTADVFRWLQAIRQNTVEAHVSELDAIGREGK